MTVTAAHATAGAVSADALDMLAGDPPRYPHVPGDFHRHPETGAPYVAHPTETTKAGVPRRVMYGRPSSFGAALDNSWNLLKWKERQLVLGLWLLEHGDGDILSDDDLPDAYRDSLIARSYEVAGTHLAADRGTHVHLLLERFDKDECRDFDELIAEGERLGIPAILQDRIVDQWVAFRARMGLTALAVEHTVVNDRWRLAGTLDRLDVADHDILTAYGVLEAGVPFVGDIKTGGLSTENDGHPKFWSKYVVQVAAYVDAVPYDTETDERRPPDIFHTPHPDIALIYHYDLARALNGEPVDWQAIPVNVDAGREGGDLCRAAADFAKRRDLFAMPAPQDASRANGETRLSVGQTDDAMSGQALHQEAGEVSARPASSVDLFAVPAGPPAVEQPAVDPEPPTASSVVPRSAAECTCAPCTTPQYGAPGVAHCAACCSGSLIVEYDYACPVAEHRTMAERQFGSMLAPTDRDRLVARIGDLIDWHVKGEPLLRGFWPEGVPTLRHEGHTDDELAQILAAVRRVEAEVGAPFHPDDSPPPQSRAAAQRALAAWGDDINGAWMAASLIATFEQCRLPDCTLDGLVGQFSIEQCERLYQAAPSTE
jgi:hypothetical protein